MFCIFAFSIAETFKSPTLKNSNFQSEDRSFKTVFLANVKESLQPPLSSFPEPYTHVAWPLFMSLNLRSSSTTISVCSRDTFLRFKGMSQSSDRPSLYVTPFFSGMDLVPVDAKSVLSNGS